MVGSKAGGLLIVVTRLEPSDCGMGKTEMPALAGISVLLI
jgi:hypothetical protein